MGMLTTHVTVKSEALSLTLEDGREVFIYADGNVTVSGNNHGFAGTASAYEFELPSVEDAAMSCKEDDPTDTEIPNFGTFDIKATHRH
jgi:hypothetical protein